MDSKKLAYIEETGLMFEQMGMTRMAGRVFGYLIVCDESEVSFDNIREALNASKGSISGTTKQLVQTGLVEPVSLPGDRKTYFKVSTIELGALLKKRVHTFSVLSKNLSKGRTLKKKKDELSEWLLEAATFYSWIETEIDQVIDKWHNEKQRIIKTGKIYENK